MAGTDLDLDAHHRLSFRRINLDAELVKRHPSASAEGSTMLAQPFRLVRILPGRPRLGVVPREVRRLEK